MKNLIKITTKSALVVLTGLIFFVFSTLWYFSSNLPDYKILSSYKPPISSRVHSGEGQLIAEYALQKRLFIPYDSIPNKVVNSFLSAEDKNFFSHPGIDAKSITRATIKNIKNIFSILEILLKKNNFQLIVIPSMRTPKKIIHLAKDYFDNNQIIVNDVDKKAYLSSLNLADYIIVTCDSTSMISEAAMTGKPIYIAQMPPIKKNERFKKFFETFKSLNIVKELGDTIENWNYEKLNETDRISSYIKEQLKNYDFS